MFVHPFPSTCTLTARREKETMSDDHLLGDWDSSYDDVGVVADGLAGLNLGDDRRSSNSGTTVDDGDSDGGDSGGTSGAIKRVLAHLPSNARKTVFHGVPEQREDQSVSGSSLIKLRKRLRGGMTTALRARGFDVSHADVRKVRKKESLRFTADLGVGLAEDLPYKKDFQYTHRGGRYRTSINYLLLTVFILAHLVSGASGEVAPFFNPLWMSPGENCQTSESDFIFVFGLLVSVLRASSELFNFDHCGAEPKDGQPIEPHYAATTCRVLLGVFAAIALVWMLSACISPFRLGMVGLALVLAGVVYGLRVTEKVAGVRMCCRRTFKGYCCGEYKILDTDVDVLLEMSEEELIESLQARISEELPLARTRSGEGDGNMRGASEIGSSSASSTGPG